MIVVVTTDLEAAKNPLCLDGFSALANLPGVGLVSLINPLGRLLEQPSDQLSGRLENGGAHHYLQFGDNVSLWRLGFEARD